MSASPSVSYSITVRLEVPASGNAVSKLTSAVEQPAAWSPRST